MATEGILDFCQRFPDQDACLQWIFERKFGDHTACPRCGELGRWGIVNGTKKYFHSCRRQVSPLKDTAFYRANVSLTACFYAIHLFANCSRGVRSTFLRKHLGLAPKSSVRLANCVRLHMSAYARPATLGGPGKVVEVDEVLLRHVRNPAEARHEATIVMGMACQGTVLTGIIANRARSTLHANILRRVAPGSIIMTDEWNAYRGLDRLGFEHRTINHSAGFFSKNGISTCQIDSYWATLRRAMRGYHQVAANNLWLLLAEIECRYNLRYDRTRVFDRLISHWPLITRDTLPMYQRRFDWREPPFVAV